MEGKADRRGRERRPGFFQEMPISRVHEERGVVELSQAEREAAWLAVEHRESFAAAGTYQDIYELCHQFMLAAGFEKFLVAFRLPRVVSGQAGEFAIHSYPRLWWDRYVEKCYIDIDPVIIRAVKTTEPFEWWEVLATTRLTPEVSKFFGDAVMHGLGAGMSARCFGEEGNQCVINLSHHNPSFRVGDRELWWSRTLLFGQRMLNAAARISAKIEKTVEPLSDRQIVALKFASEGKDAEEIAKAMGVKTETARFHLKECRARLGASSTAQAVSIAMKSGAIDQVVPAGAFMKAAREKELAAGKAAKRGKGKS